MKTPWAVRPRASASRRRESSGRGGPLESELAEDVANALGVTSAAHYSLNGEELPDAVRLSGAPRAVRDESELEEAREGAVDAIAVEAEEAPHALATVERRAVLVLLALAADEHGGCVGCEAREPTVVEEVGLEPAEGAAARPAQELGPGRCGPRFLRAHGHAPLFLAWRFFALAAVRSAARRSCRSLDSLRR